MANRTQLLHINSLNRSSGYPYDFYVNINDGLVKADKGEYLTLTIIDTCINRSWYTIDSTNNTFVVTVLSVPTIITIPTGYYDVNQLRYELSLLLVGWTITYSATTNCYTFTPPNTGNIYTFSFSNLCCNLLGFNITSTPSGTYSIPFTSYNPVKVNRENSVVVHCDVPKKAMSCVDNFSGQAFQESDIIVDIPIQVAPFDNAVYLNNGNDNFKYYLAGKQLHSMRFWITDENNRVLQVPYDWTICLKVEFLKDEDIEIKDSVNQIKDYLKLIVLNDHMDV